MTDSSETMPTDEEAEQMARVIHAGYLVDHERAEGDPAHPANVGWDGTGTDGTDALDPTLRAQNLDQAREIVTRLRELGFRVARLVDLGDERIEAFDERDERDRALIELLAIDEHDRWARQKRLQGYVHGEVRVDEGPRKTHPNLVDWDDLEEADRKKDRDPMVRIPATLAAGGWGLARP